MAGTEFHCPPVSRQGTPTECRHRSAVRERASCGDQRPGCRSHGSLAAGSGGSNVPVCAFRPRWSAGWRRPAAGRPVTRRYPATEPFPLRWTPGFRAPAGDLPAEPVPGGRDTGPVPRRGAARWRIPRGSTLAAADTTPGAARPVRRPGQHAAVPFGYGSSCTSLAFSDLHVTPADVQIRSSGAARRLHRHPQRQRPVAGVPANAGGG